MLSHTTILGIKIITNAKPDLLAFIVNYLKSQKASKHLKIHTPNPEQIVYAYEHPEFKEVLNSGDINLPDGVGIEWASKLVGSRQFRPKADPPLADAVSSKRLLPAANRPLQTISRIPGVEFMEDLVKLAAQNSWPIGFIGGRNGVAKLAFEKLQQKYTGSSDTQGRLLRSVVVCICSKISSSEINSK